MEYSANFREVTRQRLIRLVLSGALAGIVLDTLLFLAGIPDVMPFVLLGIIVILLIALFDWFDFHFFLVSRPQGRARGSPAGFPAYADPDPIAGPVAGTAARVNEDGS